MWTLHWSFDFENVLPTTKTFSDAQRNLAHTRVLWDPFTGADPGEGNEGQLPSPFQ
jgi:hypothetical protein